MLHCIDSCDFQGSSGFYHVAYDWLLIAIKVYEMMRMFTCYFCQFQIVCLHYIYIVMVSPFNQCNTKPFL